MIGLWVDRRKQARINKVRNRYKKNVTDRIVTQWPTLVGSGRLVLESETFLDRDHLQMTLVAISKVVGHNVRASAFEGMVSIYMDTNNEDDNTEVMIGMFK
jgi:hypothetical protein